NSQANESRKIPTNFGCSEGRKIDVEGSTETWMPIQGEMAKLLSQTQKQQKNTNANPKATARVQALRRYIQQRLPLPGSNANALVRQPLPQVEHRHPLSAPALMLGLGQEEEGWKD
ncbi:hypothetical protein V5O48_019135, partial [Marasmius crinis-equi]